MDYIKNYFVFSNAYLNKEKHEETSSSSECCACTKTHSDDSLTMQGRKYEDKSFQERKTNDDNLAGDDTLNNDGQRAQRPSNALQEGKPSLSERSKK